jgi:hypothetical protein
MGYFVSIFKLLNFPSYLPLIFLSPFVISSLIHKYISFREIGFLFIFFIFLIQFFFYEAGFFWDGLKQSFFCFMCFSIIRHSSDTTVLKAVKPVITMSLVLVITGLFQFFGVEPFTYFAPLANSSFIGSGGFGEISLLRPNFALGNSINVGTFFVLSVFLLLLSWEKFQALYRFLILFVFLLAIVLTLSRAAFFGVLLLTPLLIGKIGKIKLSFLFVFLVTVSYEWISFVFLRFFDGSYREGSDSDRLEMISKFLESFDYEMIFIGSVNTENLVKITDSTILYNITSLGVIVSLIFFLLIIFPIGLNKTNKLWYITLSSIFTASFFLNNSFFAFYNLFLLVYSLRLISCIFPTRSYSQFLTVKNT